MLYLTGSLLRDYSLHEYNLVFHVILGPCSFVIKLYLMHLPEIKPNICIKIVGLCY